MIHVNRSPLHGQPLLPADVEAFGAAAPAAVAEVLNRWRPCRPSPLQALPELARRIGVAQLFVKDEGSRLGLGSFKALGGAYAVMRLALEEASQRLGRTVSPADLQQPEVVAVTRNLTVACATDGNHGRSVAAGARFVGCRCVVFVHEAVSEGRMAAIADFGADVRRVPGTYDESVVEALRVASAEGWLVVSDTSWPGYERTPRIVMQGYTLLVNEVLQAMTDPPTHVFVQAGVGGLAAAVAAHISLTQPQPWPHLIVVEPEQAACMVGSAIRGAPVRVPAGTHTVMAMLECYEPSHVAWGILERRASAFMTVTDAEAVRAMTDLARPAGDDPMIVAGESGAVGIAGLRTLMESSQVAQELGLSRESRVLVLNTEGATDPALYRKLTGLSAPSGER